MSVQQSSKIEWVSIAKGIGITSVVIGHVALASELNNLAWTIYLFHMPLFFILAGYVQRPKPLLEFLATNTVKLLLPYALYVLLLSAPYFAKSLYVDGPSKVSLLDMVWGGQQLVGPLGVVWYITCLVVSQGIYTILLLLLRSPRSPAMIAVIVAIVTLGYTIGRWQPDTPWNVAAAPMAIGFIWFGNLLRTTRLSPAAGIAAAAVAVIVLLFCLYVGWPTHFDMKPLVFGTPWLSFVIATCFSLGVFSVAILLERTGYASAVAYVGTASLTIMYTHQSIHSVARWTLGDSPVAIVVLAMAGGLLLHLVIAATDLKYFFLGERRPIGHNR